MGWVNGLTIGSLFSGIGGLELGLEWAGHGPVLWQVERDPFCRDILARHWPNVERFDDVCAIGGHAPWRAIVEPVDILCGGFPCQDVSGAGFGEGLAGERSGLWFEFDRLVGELGPRWVVVENVTSGAKRWVDAVRGCLAERGYETLPLPIRASDVGAPHRRARVFIVGRLVDADGSRPERCDEPAAIIVDGRADGCEARSAEGLADSGGDRREGCTAQQRAQGGVEVARRRDADGCDSRRVAHTSGEQLRQLEQRLSGRRTGGVRDEGQAVAARDGARLRGNPQPLLGRGAHGPSAGLDASAHATDRPVRWPARRGEPQHDWEPRRAVHPSALTDRGPRLHALGNGVVPHCAEVVGEVINMLRSQ